MYDSCTVVQSNITYSIRFFSLLTNKINYSGGSSTKGCGVYICFVAINWFIMDVISMQSSANVAFI